MEEGFGTLVYLIIGYICGVLFAPDVFSANLAHTNWLNIWVYAWLLGWPIMLAFHFLGLLLAAPTIVVVKP